MKSFGPVELCYSHSLLFILFFFFFFSCGRIQTNYSFHTGKHSRLFHTSVPSLVWRLPWGNSDKPRLKVSHVERLSLSTFKSGFCRSCLYSKRVGWSLFVFPAIQSAVLYLLSHLGIIFCMERMLCLLDLLEQCRPKRR